MNSLISRTISYLTRIDEPKINKSKYPFRLILIICFKSVNFMRLVKAYVIINKVDSLSEFFDSIHIFWFRGNEGHTQQSTEQTEYLKNFVQEHQRIFEVGFNGGHSSETFLKNNSNVNVVSCDIGWHYYSRFGEMYLNKKYPGRFKLIYGDSKKVIPAYADKYKEKFDAVYIDGGHEFEDALKDIINSKSLSTQETRLLVDDVIYQDNSNLYHANKGPTKAWAQLVEEGFLKHINYYEFKSNGLHRSVVIGTYK